MRSDLPIHAAHVAALAPLTETAERQRETVREVAGRRAHRARVAPRFPARAACVRACYTRRAHDTGNGYDAKDRQDTARYRYSSTVPIVCTKRDSSTPE